MTQIAVGFLFASIIAIFSWRFRFLSASGAAAQFVLGWLLLGIGGWQWTFPMLVFFLTSSLLSGISTERKRARARLFEKTGSRDGWQVLANGGVGGMLLVISWLSHWDAAYTAYLASVSAAAADTWGTEIGILSHRNPFLILNLRGVEPGSSGAISLLGSTAGLCGAVTIACSGLMWIPAADAWPAIISAAAGGIAGSLTDSLLGASVQAQFECVVCRKRTEKGIHCGQVAERSRGFWWMHNDLVNFLCTFAGAGVGSMVFLLVRA